MLSFCHEACAIQVFTLNYCIMKCPRVFQNLSNTKEMHLFQWSQDKTESPTDCNTKDNLFENKCAPNVFKEKQEQVSFILRCIRNAHPMFAYLSVVPKM